MRCVRIHAAAAEDDAVVSRLEAPLAGVRRVDELRSLDLGDGRIERWRLEDVPFDPQAGEVLFSPAAAALRKLPANTLRVQLLAADEAGERVRAPGKGQGKPRGFPSQVSAGGHGARSRPQPRHRAACSSPGRESLGPSREVANCPSGRNSSITVGNNSPTVSPFSTARDTRVIGRFPTSAFSPATRTPIVLQRLRQIAELRN